VRGLVGVGVGMGAIACCEMGASGGEGRMYDCSRSDLFDTSFEREVTICAGWRQALMG
jgi:hypothetical protein